MKIKSIMNRDVATCGAEDSMSLAAKHMWERDCGVVPVVDEDTNRPVGVITDRDICMAALLGDRPLSELRVRDAMSVNVCTCELEDDLKTAHSLMREHQVRRLPVVDESGLLRGIVAMNDLFVEAYSRRGPAASRRQRDAARTLAAISEHREFERTATF
jgi:CBS domain-containing protein